MTTKSAQTRGPGRVSTSSARMAARRTPRAPTTTLTSKLVTQKTSQSKYGEQDLFASSNDEIKKGDTYGFLISILEDNSDENKELDASTTYSANSPAYSPTSPAYSPTSPVQSPESPTPAKPDDEWSNSSSVPPEYYVNDYSKLVNVNQPGPTSMSTLIHIIANDKKHQQGMSHHFETIGTLLSA